MQKMKQTKIEETITVELSEEEVLEILATFVAKTNHFGKDAEIEIEFDIGAGDYVRGATAKYTRVSESKDEWDDE